MHFLSTFFGSLVEKAHAQNFFQYYCEQLGQYCGSGQAFVIQVASHIEQLIIQFIVGAAVLAVIYGGLRMIISGGDDSKRDEGKNIMIVALTGLVLAIAAHAIIQFIATFVGGVVGA